MYTEKKYLIIFPQKINKKIYNLCGSVLRWSKLMLVQIVISGGEAGPQ